MIDAEAGQARDGVSRRQLLEADHTLALRVAQHVLCKHTHILKYIDFQNIAKINKEVRIRPLNRKKSDLFRLRGTYSDSHTNKYV